MLCDFFNICIGRRTVLSAVTFGMNVLIHVKTSYTVALIVCAAFSFPCQELFPPI
jgi:hypothetical protein